MALPDNIPTRLRRRGGYVLILVLLVLTLAAAALAGACRMSMEKALLASRAGDELQRRWAVTTCRSVLLPRADDVLAAAATPACEVRRDVRLGNLSLTLVFGDEQAKASVNVLYRHGGLVRAEQGVRQFVQGRSGVAIDLRPLVVHKAGNEDVDPPLFETFGQVFGTTPPALLVGLTRDRFSRTADTPGARGAAVVSGLTCWGDGTLNFRRASSEAVRQVCSRYMTGAQMSRLLAMRAKEPDLDPSEALEQLKLSEKAQEALDDLLVDDSSCHSLWIISRSDRRSWYDLSVADESSDAREPYSSSVGDMTKRCRARGNTMRTHRIKALLWLTAAAGVAGAVGALTAAWRMPLDAAAAPAAATAFADAGGPLAAPLPPLESFEEAWSRPLRRPLVDPPAPSPLQAALAAAATQPARPALMLRLIGTIVDSERPRGVFLVGISTIELKGVGERAGTAEVLKIDENSATLAFEGRTFTLTRDRTSFDPTAAALAAPAGAFRGSALYGSAGRRAGRGRWRWLMSSNAYVIFASPDGYRLAVVGGGDDDGNGVTVNDVAESPDGSEQAADAVATALADVGYRGQGVMLAIASAWCLSAAVRTDGLPAAKRRQAMLYRLEEKLPLSAEDVVADFVVALPSAGTDEAAAAASPLSPPLFLGVCAEKQHLLPLVEALESRGIAIEAICPDSLLSFQDRLANGSRPGQVDAAVLAADQRPGQWELLLLEAGRPVRWFVLPAEPKDLQLHLGLASHDGPKPRSVLLVGTSKATERIRQAIEGLPGLEVFETAQRPTVHESSAAAAAAVLAGRVDPWINLRRDDLAVGDRLRRVRTPMAFAAAAVVLCALCLCTALLWRAARYDRLTARHAAEQEEVFHQVFPRQPVPLDARSRLASEERGLRGLSGNDSAAPLPEAPGLLALRDVLARLPANVRYRILEVRLEENRFTLDGQATSHGDPDLIAEALRDGPGLSVEAPRTERTDVAGGKGDDNVVSFTITGARLPEAPRHQSPAPRAADAAAADAARLAGNERDASVPPGRRTGR